MLQIIGWLGCLYLVVKGLEVLSSKAHRDEDGTITGQAAATIIVAWVGAITFFFLLQTQGNGIGSATSPFGADDSLTVPDELDVNLDANMADNFAE